MSNDTTNPEQRPPTWFVVLLLALVLSLLFVNTANAFTKAEETEGVSFVKNTTRRHEVVNMYLSKACPHDKPYLIQTSTVLSFDGVYVPAKNRSRCVPNVTYNRLRAELKRNPNVKVSP